MENHQLAPLRKVLIRIEPLVFSLALIITLAYLCFPTQFVVEPSDNDSSYPYLYLYSLYHGLQFGLEHINTYGPLGWISQRVFIDNLSVFYLRYLFWLCLAIIICLQAVSLRKVETNLNSYLFLVSLAFAGLNADPVLYYPDAMFLMLMFWQLVFLAEREKSNLAVLISSAILLGILSLLKGTLLFLSIFLCLLCFLMLWQRRRLYAHCYLVVFVSTFLLFYCLFSQQSIFSLPWYFIASFEIADAYSMGMTRYFEFSRYTGLVLALVVWGLQVVCVFISRYHNHTKRLTDMFVFLGLSAIGFIAWKHSISRLTPTFIYFVLGSLSASSILVASSSLRRGAVLSVLLGVLVIVGNWRIFSANTPVDRLFSIQLVRVLEGVRAPLNYNTSYRSLERQYEQMKRKLVYPKLNALASKGESFDFWGSREGVGVVNGWPLKIGVVPTSAHAANNKLLRLSEKSIVENRPSFILADYFHREEHLPVQADSQWFLRFLSMYQYSFSEGRFDVYSLRSKELSQSISCEQNREINFGERIHLPEISNGGQVQLLSFRFEQGFFSKIIGIVFRREPVWINLELADGSRRNYPLNHKIAPIGFALSPFFESSKELKQFSLGKAVNSVISFSLQSSIGISNPKFQICSLRLGE